MLTEFRHERLDHAAGILHAVVDGADKEVSFQLYRGGRPHETASATHSG